MASLEAETRLFEKNRAQWVAEGQEGKWVVIHAQTIVGFFDGLELAYDAGLQKLGPVPFLVKQIKQKDDVEVVHRVLFPHPRGR